MARLCFKYGTVKTKKSEQAVRIKQTFSKHHLGVSLMTPIINASNKAEYDYVINQKENIYLTIKKLFKNTKLIIIDNSHFLDELQVDQLLQVAITLNIAVICFGIRTDFRTASFLGAKRLLEISQVIKKIPSYCSCGHEAEFNLRKENGKTIFSGEKIVNDKKIEYDKVCPNCYYRKLIQYKKLKETGKI